MARLTEEARTGSWSGGGGYICTLFWAGGDWAQICGSEHSTSLFTGHAAGQATYFTPGTLPSSEDSRYVGGVLLRNAPRDAGIR